MTKPNEKCPCGTGLKYKKCCSKKDRMKKSKVPQYFDPSTFYDDPSLLIPLKRPTDWKHYGEQHSSYRFFIGQRVECYCGRGLNYLPGIVTKFNYLEDGMSKPAAYQILLEDNDQHGRVQFIFIDIDVSGSIRPLGYTRTDTCALCGVDSTTTKLSNCSACHKIQYCSGECQQADWKKHKTICKLIIKEKRRMHDDAKKQSREIKTPQELTTMLIQAVDDCDKSMVKRLLKMKEGSFDINQRAKQGDSQGNTPLTMAVWTYRDKQDLSIVKRLLKVNGIDVNKHDLVMGGTPLWHACQKGLTLGIPIDDNHDEVVELLRSVGAKYERHKVAYDAKLHVNPSPDHHM